MLPKSGPSEEDVCAKLEVPLAILLRDNAELFTDIRMSLTNKRSIFKGVT